MSFTITKEAIKLGRKGCHSTTDYIELLGGKYDETKGNKYASKPVFGMTDAEKDILIVTLANVIMDLTSKGKFNLRDF